MALKDITLGQFFPGNSLVHRLDPRGKIVGITCYIIALFLARGVVTYGLLFLLLSGMIFLSKVPIQAIVKGMKPLVVIIVLTGLLNVLYTTGEKVLWEFWIFTVTEEGIVVAAMMVARILMLVSGTFLLTYTTSPMALTDGLENLLAPLKKWKVPVHDLAMMMSIALRFIPNLIEETDKIMSAQQARGADFESGSLFRRAKAMIPLLVPLFISALRRADELADAMDCRCYQGGVGRTRLKQMEYARVDYLVMGFMATITCGVGYLGWLGM